VPKRLFQSAATIDAWDVSRQRPDLVNSGALAITFSYANPATGQDADVRRILDGAIDQVDPDTLRFIGPLPVSLDG
jgi:hypothetical protein